MHSRTRTQSYADAVEPLKPKVQAAETAVAVKDATGTDAGPAAGKAEKEKGKESEPKRKAVPFMRLISFTPTHTRVTFVIAMLCSLAKGKASNPNK